MVRQDGAKPSRRRLDFGDGPGNVERGVDHQLKNLTVLFRPYPSRSGPNAVAIQSNADRLGIHAKLWGDFLRKFIPERTAGHEVVNKLFRFGSKFIEACLQPPLGDKQPAREFVGFLFGLSQPFQHSQIARRRVDPPFDFAPVAGIKRNPSDGETIFKYLNLAPWSGQLHHEFTTHRAGDFFQCLKREICRLAFVTANRAARRPDFLGKGFLGETGAFTNLGRISKEIHLMSINHA